MSALAPEVLTAFFGGIVFGAVLVAAIWFTERSWKAYQAQRRVSATLERIVK